MIFTFTFGIYGTVNTIYAQSSSQITINQINAAQSIGKYQKFEVSFKIENSTAQNFQWPYDAITPTGVPAGQGITVDGLFSPDNGQTWETVPGFYYQDFLWEQKENRDWVYPSGQFVWKIRFAPNKVGGWQYKIRAQDAGGVSESPTMSFTVTESADKGFIKVSSNDPRYFEYGDGSYFPGLGLNFRANTDDIEDNESDLSMMGQNGIQIARMWLSSWSIFGSAWNPWNAMPQDYDGYLPRTGLEVFDGAFRLKLVYRLNNGSWWKATRFLGWLSPKVAVEKNKNYRIKVKYRAMNISGPRSSQYPNYGLVVKITNQWLETPHDGGTGTPVTAYGGSNAGWSDLVGTWNSGNNNFLPNMYLTLENVNVSDPPSTVYIDQVWLEEDLGGGNYGVNILNKPLMEQNKYFDQRNSLAFDKLLDLAEKQGVYLKPVITEKEEYILNHIDQSGNLHTDDPAGLFYGSGTDIGAGRWYQEAWWRYLQARWGYSTHIHSWELVNEGDPFNTNHYILTDLLGQYMRRFTINRHMVSTSNWHSFPASSWRNFANIDFSDVHYYQPRNAAVELADPALATFNRSMSYGAKQPGGSGKPVIRGETGFVETGSGPAIRDFDADTAGVWLHKFLWGQINSGGMMEFYWYTGGADGHINRDRSGVDLRPEFGKYYRFIKDVPLSNGKYEDISASISGTGIRVWGQKDTTNGSAHLWIGNLNHTWGNVIGGININPVTGTVTIGGFKPNESKRIEWWNTFTGLVTNTTNQITNSNGDIVLAINNLTSDMAVKIEPVNTGQGDANGDSRVDGIDYVIWLNHYNSTSVNGSIDGDFNVDGRIDGMDYVIWLNNYGI